LQLNDRGVDAESAGEADAGYGRLAARGTLWTLAVHILLLPLGFVTSVFLTRRLGPERFGLFSVAAGIVLWVEAGVGGMFGGTTVKFVAEAEDWREVASALMRTRFFISLGATAALLLVAPVVSLWLGSPEMTSYLRLFALEIPVVALVSAHLSTLAGRRAFGRLALVTGVYGLGRMVLVLLLVGWGLSLTGAILANLGALAVQLAVARIFIRPTLRAGRTAPLRGVAGYAWPLLLYTIGRTLFVQVDLLTVKAISGAAAAGFYGAAQALTRPLGLFVASFTTPFLATLSRMFQDGRTELAGSMIGHAMRLVLCFLPFVALVAGSATEIVGLVYGPTFSAAAPLLALLLFGSVANVMVSVIAVVLTAVGRPGWAVAMTWPLLPVTVGACLVAIPRIGPSGAAAAMTGLSWLGAIAMVLSVHRHVGVHPGPATVLRVSGTTLVAYALSSLWQSTGAWVILELSVITAVVFVCLCLLGELTTQDLTFAISVVRRAPE